METEIQNFRATIEPRHFAGVAESLEQGLVLLSPKGRSARRRILYVNSYGGADVWEQIKNGLLPGHHLWGCIELAQMGYEVLLAEPLPHFNYRRGPIPHDLRLLNLVKEWLSADGILYSGHTLLYWLPLLKQARLLKRKVVSLMYAREELDWARAHCGIIAMTPAAEEKAKQLSPRTKVARLPWGVDLDFFPRLPYDPQTFLSCGITNRDHRTLCAAAKICKLPIRLICPGHSAELDWPSNVDVVDSGRGWNFQKKKVAYDQLLTDFYARATASIVVLKNDPTEDTANGFTNLLETMAMGRPVIFTRTGAVPGELDVKASGIGLHVPADNPPALAEAIKHLAEDPVRAQAMGDAGRQLCRTRYSMENYAQGLHRFFETL
jgi:glycosyltransferase involved in cell wall biosynthesis